jgi:hypothetical protein
MRAQNSDNAEVRVVDQRQAHHHTAPAWIAPNTLRSSPSASRR